MGFIFFVKKFVVNFFCRSAEPLYFSLVRMLSIVVAYHFSLPPGVGTPFLVRLAAIAFVVLPCMNKR